MDISQIVFNKIRVAFKSNPIKDIEKEVAAQMELFKPAVSKDMKVAVAVGSRGIANLPEIIKSAVKCLKSFGAKPFIVPAMGSHGGATPAGQLDVLAQLGVNERFVGCPIRSSMEVASLGVLHANHNIKMYMDRNAYNADGVLLVNRVKAHTDYHGPNESGLVKLLVVGLGKHEQAKEVHKYLADGLCKYVPEIAGEILKTGKIIGGLGIVEDGYDQTAVIKAVQPNDMLKEDAKLLVLSKSMMPKLPFCQCDILLIDWIGKNISGTGLDTNIIGRLGIRGKSDSPPDITCICVFNLTPETHGNAVGVGLADIIPKHMYREIDWESTYINVLTSRFLQRGFMPIVQTNDREAINAALNSCGVEKPESVKIARIKDTLHISDMYVTDALWKDISENKDVTPKEYGCLLRFDSEGNLTPM